MTGGQNLLDGKKGISAPEFICGHTRILVMHSIVQPHRVVNGYLPQFSSDSTLETAQDRVNYNGAVHLDKRLDSMFGDAFLISSTSSTKSEVLVLLN